MKHNDNKLNDPITAVEAEKKFGRIYLPELDGLRFFAFLLVFIHHNILFSQIPYLFILKLNGWIGVDLFFVLSAFLFTKLLIAEYQKTGAISFKKFYIRRIFRIWPLYFFFISLATVVYVFVQGQSITKYIFIRLVGLFTFSDNVMAAVNDYHPIPYLAHLWTIDYEEQFYIFIPLIILLLVRSSFKRKMRLLILSVVLLNITRIIFIVNHVPRPAIWVLPVTHFESIIMGIVIGFGGMEFLSKRIHPLIIGFAGIVFFLLLRTLPKLDVISYQLIISYFLIGLSSSCILIAVLNSDLLKRFFSKQLFVFLGKRSYGLYVYHLLGNLIAGNMAGLFPALPSGALALFLYSLFITITMSIISYKIIEAPFLRWKKKFEVIVSRPV